MVSFKIPERYLAGIEKIAYLEDELFQSILTAIEGTAPSLSRSKTIKKISSQVEEISPGDLDEILAAVISLHSFLEYLDYQDEDFIDQINLAISESIPNLTDKEKDRLIERLIKLLDIDSSLGVSSKAVSLVQDYERLYVRSRILTDIRPIFKSDLKHSPLGALIIHVLKLQYFENYGEKEFFIALDSKDLRQLRKQIERAERKEETLELMLGNLDISYVKMESEQA